MAKKSSIRRNFKKKESKICALFGLKRLPLTGQAQPDCLSNDWAIEIFTRKMPKWLKQEYQQAELGVKKRDKGCLALAIWLEKNKQDKEGFVLLKLRDFIDNFV